MPERVAHGGHCCGINHIYGFDIGYGAREISSFRHHIPHASILLEIVLTDDQMVRANQNLLDWMQENRFVLVSRFRNPNSSNMCNVFHNRNEPANEAPTTWRGEVRYTTENRPAIVADPPPAPPAPPPRDPIVVHTSFHNVYPRSGRSQAGWPTEEAARAHLRGNNGRVERCIKSFNPTTHQFTETWSVVN